MSSSKQVLSFSELQQRLQSPLAKSIRDQILKSDEKPINTPTNDSNNKKDTPRRQFFATPSPRIPIKTEKASRLTISPSQRVVSSMVKPSKTPPVSVVTPKTMQSTSSLKKTPIKTPPLAPTRTPLSALNRSSETSTRRNLDKRTARLRYSNEFAAEIAKHNNTTPVPPVLPSSQTIQVYVRKRPMLNSERERGDFDIVQTHPTHVQLFRTKLEADMKTKTVQPVLFPCTAALEVDNDTVYQIVGQPLVHTVLQKGHSATLLMFGQTGSGKSYTMTAIQERLIHDLDYQDTTVQYLELAGKNVQDLLHLQRVTLRDAPDGSVSFCHAQGVQVASPGELSQVLQQAQQRRATQATTCNAVSSRSHAVCRITFHNGAVLTLVDCAGTERRNDSLYHSKSRQVESNEINASLYALKECIRSRATGKHVPYRMNNLTRVLRQSLEDPQALLTVVATVAPNATDFEHSAQTLETVSSLWGATSSVGTVQTVTPTRPTEPAPTAPKSWTHEELVEWLERKRLICDRPLSPDINGRVIMRMGKIQLKNLLYEQRDDAKADQLFQLLRAESDKVARLELKKRMAIKSPRVIR